MNPEILSIGNAVRRTVDAGFFANYREASDAIGDALRVPSLACNLTTESRLAEVVATLSR